MKKIIIIIILIVILLPAYIIFGATKPTSITPIYYEKILIQPGDTLSSIAEKNNTSHMSNKVFIKYLKDFNNMNTDLIYFGNYIIVPIFTS